MADFHFVHPGDLATRTGGYRYARSLLDVLRTRGVAVAVHRLADSFPFPDAAALTDADRRLSAIADGSTVVVDGLAFGAMPAVAARHGARLRLVALVHHPLALETGIAPEAAARLAASERHALRSARAVVVTSPATRLAMQDYGVPASRVTVVLPGTDVPVGMRSHASSAAVAADVPAREIRLLCVASVTPRKGQLELVEALAACRAREPASRWRLVCVGSLDRDPAYAADVQARVRALGLQSQVDLVGERDEQAVDRAYDEADVFVLASHHEGYGMVLAEAIGHGLPVVSTTAGAIPQTVPSDAGLLVPPGDVGALAAALAAVIGRADVRRALAAAARRAAQGLPDWQTAAQRFLGMLASVAAEGGGAGHRGGGDGGGGGSDVDGDGSDGDGSDGDGEQAAAATGAERAFAGSWLALREPHDHAARADALTRQLAGFLRERPERRHTGRLRILDLGCGTGSTLRYLSPRLGGAQAWTLVDNDATLLASLPQAQALAAEDRGGPDLHLAPLALELAEGLERLPLAEVDLVTASALLDLVSASWLDRLVAQATAAAAPGSPPAMLLALSYDGVISWRPAHPDDGWAAALFNRHQRGDKGFGPALGPAATDAAARCLRAAGYRVTTAASPWRLGAAHGPLQRAFLAGMAAAVAALAEGSEQPRLQAWVSCREAWLAQQASGVAVGHRDLLALPPVKSRPRRP